MSGDEVKAAMLGGLDILAAFGGLGGLQDVEAQIVRMSDVTPEEVQWLWPGYIPLSALTVFDGDPDLGKSTIMGADIAARVTRGLPMPDGQNSDIGGPAGVVLMSLEDDAATTLVPRLIAAGADLTRVCQIQSVGTDRALPNVEDMAAMLKAIQSVDARLLVIDPIAGHLPKWANPNQDKDVRIALMPLALLAQTLKLAVVVIRHLTKVAGGGNPMYRGQASIAFIAAARAGVVVGKDPDDPDNRRILASTKHNLTTQPPSLVYRLETSTLNGVVRVAWLPVGTTHTAETLLAVQSTADERSAVADAADALTDILGKGPLIVEEIRKHTAAAGLSWRTIERAKDRLGIRSKKDGSGPWMWHLPEPKTANTAKDRQDNQSANVGGLASDAICTICTEPLDNDKPHGEGKCHRW